jgi:hypothetical protein
MCTAGADLGDHEAMARLVSDTAWKADILWLPQDHSEKSKLHERALRRISGTMDWREQITQFEQLYAGKVPNRMW